jgi:hypothetical protein
LRSTGRETGDLSANSWNTILYELIRVTHRIPDTDLVRISENPCFG